jgi:nicotinamidase-related amidase
MLKLGRLNPSKTLLLLCDMQEKFATTIKYFDEVVKVSERLLDVANMLQIPVVGTEQYPKGIITFSS